MLPCAVTSRATRAVGDARFDALPAEKRPERAILGLSHGTSLVFGVTNIASP